MNSLPFVAILALVLMIRSFSTFEIRDSDTDRRVAEWATDYDNLVDHCEYHVETVTCPRPTPDRTAVKV